MFEAKFEFNTRILRKLKELQVFCLGQLRWREQSDWELRITDSGQAFLLHVLHADPKMTTKSMISVRCACHSCFVFDFHSDSELTLISSFIVNTHCLYFYNIKWLSKRDHNSRKVV